MKAPSPKRPGPLPPLPTPEEAALIERRELLAIAERLCRDALAEATATTGRPNPSRGVPR